MMVISLANKSNGNKSAFYWGSLALLFLFLSVDESAGMHELFIIPLRNLLNATGIFYFAWVIPALGFLIFCFGFYWRFLFSLPRIISSRIVLAAFIFIGVTIIGFIKHGLGYLKLFVPSGVPIVLLPLIVVIEIISYLSRPISLSVRLFANMMAGHTMMKVFGGFVISLGVVGGWLPLSFSVALTGLEILVAFLQAYVFAILTCIYLNDALNLHH